MKISHFFLYLQLDRTALQWAAANGHLEIIQMLINASADIEAQDKVICFSEPHVSNVTLKPA